jgi:hypothetical protein
MQQALGLSTLLLLLRTQIPIYIELEGVFVDVCCLNS